ncbi:MAG: class B sortase [Clostridia bacterium]|nr:class B sortase [Clostridia bacterium]
MKKSTVMMFIAVILAVIAVSSGIVFFSQMADENKAEQTYENLSSLVSSEVEHEKDEVIDLEGNGEHKYNGPTSYEKYLPIYEQNDDFIAWIKIDGTKIDYPVMQSADDPNFYLKHAFDKSYSDYGVPYIQENCLIDNCDNIVVYGHNMNNGSMFADLCKYEDEEFYKEHKYIQFDTLLDYGRYEIVAVFKTVAYNDAGFKYFQFVDAEDEADFNEYIETCKSLQLYDIGVDAEYGDRLLTLSTCEYSQTDGRIVVVAKLVDNMPMESDVNE